MNAISFSLYGSNPKYCTGMIRNAELAMKHYRNWKVWVYIDSFVPPTITNQLLDLGCALEGVRSDVPFMMNRFLIADKEQVERFIVRDADSRIGPEEAAAVQEWIEDDTILHTCRSHPAHCRPINGGMWGGMWRRSNWGAPSMEMLLKEYLDTHARTYTGHDPDQDFLNKMIWPWAKYSCTQHQSRICGDHYPGAKPFPIKWQWPRFMGEVYEVNANGEELPRSGDWEQIPQES